MKMRFASNDILPTDNIINMHQVTIIIRLVFQKGKKLYPQIYLDDCLYESEGSFKLNCHYCDYDYGYDYDNDNDNDNDNDSDNDNDNYDDNDNR